MRKVMRIDEVHAALAEPRVHRHTVGLVPTMGAFHQGHLSLIARAREACDVVVVSVFVNPAQFDDPVDLEAYPRNLDRDAGLAAEAGADLLFAPSAEEIYPPGFATSVCVAGITEVLEGAQRGRGHFDGVATVVTKLFNIVCPDVAYFGQKDAQQALVIRRLVADLALPVRVEVCPTVREEDGLALSSRNARLNGPDRERATALRRALVAIARSAREGERDPAAARAIGLAELEAAGIEPEYLELVRTGSLTAVDTLEGEVLAVVAARVGDTRLIDNELINHNGRP